MVSQTIAYIFINTGCKELEYKDHRIKKKCIENLYQNLLEFQEVKVYENKNKFEMIEILQELNAKARDYEI